MSCLHDSQRVLGDPPGFGGHEQSERCLSCGATRMRTIYAAAGSAPKPSPWSPWSSDEPLVDEARKAVRRIGA